VVFDVGLGRIVDGPQEKVAYEFQARDHIVTAGVIRERGKELFVPFIRSKPVSEQIFPVHEQETI